MTTQTQRPGRVLRGEGATTETCLEYLLGLGIGLCGLHDADLVCFALLIGSQPATQYTQKSLSAGLLVRPTMSNCSTELLTLAPRHRSSSPQALGSIDIVHGGLDLHVHIDDSVATQVPAFGGS